MRLLEVKGTSESNYRGKALDMLPSFASRDRGGPIIPVPTGSSGGQGKGATAKQLDVTAEGRQTAKHDDSPVLFTIPLKKPIPITKRDALVAGIASVVTYLVCNRRGN